MIIGISGVARSGKDTLARELCENFKKCGVYAKTYSFAFELKKELDELLLKEFGISAFTENAHEKVIVRPMLIAYGQAKRNISNGNYWIQKLLEKVNSDNPQVAIIPDVRFAENDTDEVGMIKSMGGVIIHLSRILDDGTYVPPASDDEARNNPKIRDLADLSITWPNLSAEELSNSIKPIFEKLYAQYIR